MIQIGIKQPLEVTKEVEFGVFLNSIGGEDDAILLPKKQVPEGTKIGDVIEVFVYRDSEDRMIATTIPVKIELGELGLLTVNELTRIGAFLDWGLGKDLFLPFKEQKGQLKEGKAYLVALYIDKSDRLCATMNIYEKLDVDHSYKVDDQIEGIVYDIKEPFGAFVAIDNTYHGLIQEKDLYGDLHIGDPVEARVTKVREDGKIELNLKQKVHIQIDQDVQLILDRLEENKGVLYFNDKSNPDMIRKYFHISKKAFKRAVGSLLKSGRIEITEAGIRLKQDLATPVEVAPVEGVDLEELEVEGSQVEDAEV
ncbi:MAG: S1-like domain-containing RNA-binding protein [Vallitaleaceae bacterium]|jgi:predicted RNA-binding protein (virulence factor B family)|nr:S1-like domain-containing RNA-binding protein [Vallitaleaceae bacterium]